MSCLFVVGCQEQKQDLSDYIQAVEQRQKPDIEPLPTMKPYVNYAYSASDLRSPFVRTVTEAPEKQEVSPNLGNGIEPDHNRQKEALEEFSLSELQFVGTLGMNETWGLIRSSDGVIHRVQIGNYMGFNHGRISAIGENDVTLDEIVSDGKGAYVERQSTLAIVDIK
jgi:type IV pilus assembly protein PilP